MLSVDLVYSLLIQHHLGSAPPLNVLCLMGTSAPLTPTIGGSPEALNYIVHTLLCPAPIPTHLPEGVPYLLVVKGVYGNLCDNVGEGHHQDGEQEEHHGVEEGVEGEGEQDNQLHPQHHRTQLHVLPVHHIQNWGGEGRGGEGSRLDCMPIDSPLFIAHAGNSIIERVPSPTHQE